MTANGSCLVLVVLLVVAGCTGSEEVATTSTTQASVPATSVTTNPSMASAVSIPDQSYESLRDCVVGEWEFDADGYEETSNIRGRGFIIYELVSGSGHLSISADQTLSASYNELTIDIHWLSDYWSPASSSEPDIATSSRVVVSGSVTRPYEAGGDVIVPGEAEKLDMRFRTEMDGEEITVFPLHRGSFVYGPMVLDDGTTVRVDELAFSCDEDQLMIQVRLRDDVSGDIDPTIWRRK